MTQHTAPAADQRPEPGTPVTWDPGSPWNTKCGRVTTPPADEPDDGVMVHVRGTDGVLYRLHPSRLTGTVGLRTGRTYPLTSSGSI